MNILLINHYAGSIQHGMEYRPFYLAREWVRNGHDVTILAASFSHVRSTNPAINGNFQEGDVGGVRFIWVKTPTYNGNGNKRALNIIVFVTQIMLHQKYFTQSSPQIVIASSTHPLDIYPAAIIARKCKAKLVFEVHDLWPLTLIEIGKMSPKHPFVWLLQWAEDYAYRNADRVVSILPKADTYMVEHGMRPEKFVYIPNGIDRSEWDGQNNSLPIEIDEVIQAQKKDGKFIIGYAGSHGIANNLDLLLEAAKLLRDTPVIIFLVGNGPQKARLVSRVANEDLNNVKFLERVNKNVIPSLLLSMDILYIGLKNEPLFRFGISPNKLFEYMMAGKPIINTIKAGNDPVSECQCGITISSEKPEEIAEATLKLIGLTEEERHQMGERGKKYVIANHDYQVLADKFIKSVESLN